MPHAAETLKRFPVQAGTIPRRIADGRESRGVINGSLIAAAPGLSVPDSVFEPVAGVNITAAQKTAARNKRNKNFMPPVYDGDD
jgi:hypothetical protein